MNIINIRFHMIKSTDINHRPGNIHSLCHQINIPDHFIILRPPWVFYRFIKSFIERAPADNGGMVSVTFQDFQPFWQKNSQTFWQRSIQSPVAIFPPDQIAQPVCMVKEPFFKYFFMKSCPVKTKLF